MRQNGLFASGELRLLSGACARQEKLRKQQPKPSDPQRLHSLEQKGQFARDEEPHLGAHVLRTAFAEETVREVRQRRQVRSTRVALGRRQRTEREFLAARLDCGVVEPVLAKGPRLVRRAGCTRLRGPLHRLRLIRRRLAQLARVGEEQPEKAGLAPLRFGRGDSVSLGQSLDLKRLGRVRFAAAPDLRGLARGLEFLFAQHRAESWRQGPTRRARCSRVDVPLRVAARRSRLRGPAAVA